MASTISGAITHSLLIYLFYFTLEWGFTGVCYATAGMFMVRFCVNLGIVLFSGIFETFDDVHLFSRQSTTGYEEQFKLGLGSMAMGIWGWWAFDIFTLIASYLGP
jgi:Na+-driven multidrug efflux pump